MTERDVESRWIRRARGEKVSRALAREIVRHIADQGLEAGAKLAPERVMAQEHGVGRTTVREALRLLELAGLIVVRPGIGGGPVVAAPTADDFGEVLTMHLQVAGSRVRELHDALIVLEGAAAWTAAERVASNAVDDADLAALWASTTGSFDDESVLDEKFIDEASRFHHEVQRLADNHVLRLFNESTGALFSHRAVRSGTHFHQQHRSDVARDHRRIAAAIAAGKARRAHDLMAAHMAAEAAYLVERNPGAQDDIIDWR